MGMDIVLLGTSRLLYHCAETIRTFYGRDKAVTILDTDPSPINQKYKAEFPIVSGTKQELMDYLRSINADTVVLSVNNRYLIPADVIRLPQLVLINLHHALLPAHPGRNAEAWTIFEGDAVGGITWHYIDAGIDTGRILLQKATQITGQMRSIDLLKACEELAVCSLKELLPLEQALLLPSRVQQTQDRIVHRAGQIPGEGYLNRNWDIDQMSRFLRAMDYGAKYPLGHPLVSIGGERFWIRRYTIEKTENAVSSNHSDYNPEKREMTIREKDCRITLNLRKG
ncbi:MAG: hypothetical protein IJ711_08260 [Lachnospiraceae bacterium]|nr:hypothetical protein [Lachnospiraceae bacterium]